jgi:hypothetical protein
MAIMTKSIQLSVPEWQELKNILSKEHPPSVLLLREKMKTKLGFVPRLHHWNEEHTDKHGRDASKYFRAVMLDFYSEKRYTWFLMKYSDFINSSEHYGKL